MAKSNKTFWTAASVIIGLVLIGSGMLVTFTRAQAGAEAVGDKVAVVKAEGCLPARKANTDVSVLKVQLKAMETIQTTRHTELLEAIRKNPAPP